MYGGGICTFSPSIKGFDKLFQDGVHIVYFDSPYDCFNKIKEYLKDDKFEKIAQNGHSRALEIANAARVSKFMLEAIFEYGFSQDYEWREFMFKNGEKI
ncbi:glycosyltransferase [Campylobacter hyointestinalis]|uniref:glycosyltransferase n=1 Tax=Campylobacter hyointestinalis TaxID=198 RepID=UPI0033078F56